LEKGTRQIGSAVNKMTGNKIGDSKFGKKVYSAYDKVANLGTAIANEAPELKKNFQARPLSRLVHQPSLTRSDRVTQAHMPLRSGAHLQP
jgi:hypothetical protein